MLLQRFRQVSAVHQIYRGGEGGGIGRQGSWKGINSFRNSLIIEYLKARTSSLKDQMHKAVYIIAQFATMWIIVTALVLLQQCYFNVSNNYSLVVVFVGYYCSHDFPVEIIIISIISSIMIISEIVVHSIDFKETHTIISQ